MGKGRLVPKNKLTPAMKGIYWVEINGSPVDKVPLKKSREIKQESKSRKVFRYSDSHRQKSARVSPKSGGVLDTGIQNYRHWFQFLKLSLELEELGVNLIVTKQCRIMKR